MKNKLFALLALAATAPMLHAQSVGGAEADLDYLFLTPLEQGAEVVLSNPWLISVISSSTDQINTDLQSDGGLAGDYYVLSGVTFAGGEAGAIGDPYDDPYGIAGGGAGSNFPDTYSANGFAATTFSNTFQVTGGEGPTTLNITALIYTFAGAASAGPGYFASAYSSFAIFINNSAIPFLETSFSFTASGEEYFEDGFEGSVSDDLEVNFNEDIDIMISLYAEITAEGDGSEPVPEASTVLATALGIGALALSRRFKRA